MSFYNMLHGQNPIAGALLAILGFKSAGDVGRFRDAFVSDGEIAVYTRNGGGNREHWNDEKEAGPECGCTGCVATYALPSHPLYLRDEDDDFDCTYATFYFSIPEAWRSLLSPLDAGEFDRDARWQAVFDRLRTETAAATTQATEPGT